MNLTLSRAGLAAILNKVCYYPHKEQRRGELVLHPDAYRSPDGCETNLSISSEAQIDLTGNVEIGPWCMIGEGVKILTHDHFHSGRSKTLIELQEEKGIWWKDKRMGRDVWIHNWAIILPQVTEIPSGAVIGAGTVLTKNPGPYEIWAGNPGTKIGKRT